MEAVDDRELIWPSLLRLPARPPVLVYLDLNHWIGLSRAKATPAAVPRYVDLLDAARRATARGAARFVISDVHYFEVSKIADPRQRSDIADVMEELAFFTTILGRVEVLKREVEEIANIVASGEGAGEFDFVGFGVWHTNGKRIGLRLVGADGNIVEPGAALGIPSGEAEALMAAAEIAAQKKILMGPNDNQVETLRNDYGYAPERAYEIAERRYRIEEDIKSKLDQNPTWRRTGLRNVVGANEVNNEIGRHLQNAADARGYSLSELIQVREDVEYPGRLIDRAPSIVVATSLKYSYHRNGQRSWTVNDIHDIDALAVAVPYCDVVFTDAEARDAVMRQHLHTKMHTQIPRTVTEMVQLLDELPSKEQG